MKDITVYVYLKPEDILAINSLIIIGKHGSSAKLSNGDTVYLCNGEIEIEHGDIVEDES